MMRKADLHPTGEYMFNSNTECMQALLRYNPLYFVFRTVTCHLSFPLHKLRHFRHELIYKI